MIFLPAVFFGLCFLISIRKYGWNIEAYLFMLYFLTGIASVILDAQNLYNYNCPKSDLGFFAPLSYCFFLYLCIKPFGVIFRSDLIRRVTVNNERILDYFIYFCFVVFLIIALVSFDRINDILFNTALSETRREAYMGEVRSFYDAYTGLPRYICALSTFFYPMTFFCLPLLFYNILYRNKSLLFHIITILASSAPLLSSILQADRSQFLYWMILLGFSFTLYVKQFNSKQIGKFFIIISPIIVGIVAYFVAVSISRWGDDSSGDTILYMGMNYINYCNFLNTIWGAPISLCELFPFTYFLLGKPGYFEFAQVVSNYTHLTIATFPTFLGLIFSISGPIVLLFYLLFYWLISPLFLRRKVRQTVTVNGIIRMWIVALVPLLGVFGYFYMEMNATLAIIFWLILGSLSKKKIIKKLK
jgi:hypothetical protein